MNKLLLYLPKQQILSYLNKNFEELTETDFFNIVSKKIKIPKEYYQRNQTLKSSPTVLKYVLENDLDALFQFNNEAFTEENLHILAKLDFSFTIEDIAAKHIILNNEKIREKLTEKNQSIITLFTEKQLTPSIIKILEQKKYLVSKEDLKNFPILSESKTLMINAFMNDVNMLVELSPTFITDNIIISAYQRNYIATEEDLIKNPYLCNFIEIMEPAIENNPELIKYITSSCNISQNLIKEALQKYKITKEDLINYPELRENINIMCHIPELELYSAFVDDETKKQVIINCLKNKEELTIENLPFFDKRLGSKVDIEDIKAIIDIISLDIDNDEEKEQKEYYKILDKIIDGTANIRYLRKKRYI